MTHLLVFLIVIGLVGLGLLVCGVVGYMVWQYVGVILLIIIMVAVGTGLANGVLKKIRKTQGIEDHVYPEEEDV